MNPSRPTDLVSTFNALLFAALVISGLALDQRSRSNPVRKMDAEQCAREQVNPVFTQAADGTSGDKRAVPVKLDAPVVREGR